MAKVDPKRRRWFQFSLRTVLMMTAVTAVIVAVYRPEPPRGRPLSDGWSIYEQSHEETTFDFDPNIGTSHYKMDVRAGRFIVRDATGRKRVDGRFERNEATGRWTVFDAKGRILLRGNAEQNVPSGEWTGWHANGRKAAAVSFREPDRRDAGSGKVPFAQSLREGPATFWDTSGEAKASGSHLADRRHGVWELRSSAGNTQRVAYFEGLQHDAEADRFLGHIVDWDRMMNRVQVDLDSDDAQRQDAALGMVSHLGTSGISMLSRRLATSSKGLTLSLLAEIQPMGERAGAAEDAVTAHTTSEDEEVSISAILTLVAIGAARAERLGQFVDRLGQLPAHQRFSYILQAASLDEDAVPILEQMLRSDDRPRRRCVFQIMVAMLDATQQTSDRLECQAVIVAALQRIQSSSDAELSEAAKKVLADYPNWEFRDRWEHQGASVPVVG